MYITYIIYIYRQHGLRAAEAHKVCVHPSAIPYTHRFHYVCIYIYLFWCALHAPCLQGRELAPCVHLPTALTCYSGISIGTQD